jgi:hypothetical protein
MSSPHQPAAADPIRVSVGHLLSRAYSLPCSTAAQAFTQLVQPTSRFQLALDALLPLLDPNTPAEVRVLCLSGPKLSFTSVRHISKTALPTDSCFFYSVLLICAPSDRHQPVQICTVRHIRPGEGKGCECGETWGGVSERAAGVGFMENIKGRWQRCQHRHLCVFS